MNVCIGGAYLQNFMICILQTRTPKPVFAASYDYTPVVKHTDFQTRHDCILMCTSCMIVV